MDLFRWFKPLLKVEKVSIDNNVFRLHYKFTMIMLIIFAIILSSKQYFGDPIKCDVGIDRSKDVIETYCWIYGTYIVKRSLTDRLLPGLGIDTSYDPPRNVIDHRRTAANPDDQLLFQKYYQWVCVVFCIQALMFYLPRYLWRLWENGRLNLLIKDLSKCDFIRNSAIRCCDYVAAILQEYCSNIVLILKFKRCEVTLQQRCNVTAILQQRILLLGFSII